MKARSKFKMPSAYTILIFIIVVVAILTWVVPAGKYIEKENINTKIYQSIPSNPQGLWNVISAPIAGFFDAIDIALFVIVIGGFLGVVMKSGALEAGISSILRSLKGKEQMLIPILMILFSIGGTTFGMAEETIVFYPLLIPVFLLAGYDVVVPVMVILLGAGTGVLGSTINPFSTGVASSAANVSLADGLLSRIIILFATTSSAIFFTMKYASMVKADKTKSIVASLHENHIKHFLVKEQKSENINITTKDKTVLWLFGLTFLIMILSVIPWAYKFNIDIFENIYNWLAQWKFFGLEHTLSENYLANKTSSASFGDWWFGHLCVLFFVMAVIIGYTSGMKENEIVESFIDGSKSLLGVAIIIGVSRGIKIVMDAGGMSATVLNFGAVNLKDLGEIGFINLTYLFYIPMSFLIPSTSGLAGASIPIMGPLGDLIGTGAGNVITAFQSAVGLVNLVTPTSGVVMGGLLIAKLPYDIWLKHIFKYLFILSAIIMIVLSLVVFSQ